MCKIESCEVLFACVRWTKRWASRQKWNCIVANRMKLIMTPGMDWQWAQCTGNWMTSGKLLAGHLLVSVNCQVKSSVCSSLTLYHTIRYDVIWYDATQWDDLMCHCSSVHGTKLKQFSPYMCTIHSYFANRQHKQQDATLSQGAPRDATVNFGTHMKFTVASHSFCCECR